jgi:serine/threonine-protein kinase
MPFGRYRLLELLGRGGMGEVWRAHDTAMGRTVAIKMLLPHFARDHTFEQRFRREARAAARLDEPHVVPVHDFGEIDGRLYVTMRLIDGVDLQSLLAGGPLQPERAVRIIEQVASALHSAHRVGLVHRDVKPSNVLLAEDDFAYLIDFGIARAAGETGLTSTGATIGTWSYMAPERFGPGEIEPTSDIYALGCLLYECLTGQPPFAATAVEQIVVAHLTAPRAAAIRAAARHRGEVRRRHRHRARQATGPPLRHHQRPRRRRPRGPYDTERRLARKSQPPASPPGAAICGRPAVRTGRPDPVGTA